MLISYKWLKKYLPDFELGSLDTFKTKLDTRLSEVANIMAKGEELSNLVIAEILEVNDHPTNSKLHICEVNVGKEENVTIVCGAPNARVGLKTVACLPGGKVYNPNDGEVVNIEARQMGSITSEGMLCSPAELGMGREHDGIIEVAASMPAGTPIREVMQDVIIEIENKSLPHRADAFGHIGIAREVAAIFKTRFEQPQAKPAKQEGEILVRPVHVSIQSSSCTRYSGIRISGVEVGPSPLWLQTALSYAGIRPINNVVDVTNYVMLDLGQPIHAFDLDRLQGDIIVREAKKQEKIVTLDGVIREMPEKSVVIADRSGAIAIGGIMGGASTEITAQTRNIFIEAANFEMFNIRRTSRSLGLRTDASSRFEKGLDPTQTVNALQTAAKMVVDVCGGDMVSEVTDIYPDPLDTRVVKFDLGQVKKLLGIDLDKNGILEALKFLNIHALDSERIAPEALIRQDLDAIITLQIPSYRRDLRDQEDILEEIGRLYGYENILPTLPNRDLKAPDRNKLIDTTYTARESLAAAGLTEVYTYAMVGEDLYKQCLLDVKDMVQIPEPISPELEYVRDQIVPSLLAKININSMRYDEFGLFEVAKVAYKQKDYNSGLPLQVNHLAAIVTAKDEITAYRWLKFGLEKISSDQLHNQLQFKSAKGDKNLPKYLHPGKSASLWIGKELLGYTGILHPQVAENLDLRQMTAACEINFDHMFEVKAAAEQEFKLKPISDLQPVLRDMSFWKPKNTYLSELLEALGNAEINMLEEVRVLDIFRSKEGESITLRLVIQPTEKTLSQPEIEAVTQEVNKVAIKLSYSLRG